ncbi:MAG: ABC transporter ATP-binding protein [Parvularculaceae bacterium]
MSEEFVINVRKLTKRLGGVTVVDSLDLSVPKGVIYGFLGPNGSGKTTTIRMVCGLIVPDGGEGECLGFDLKRDRKKIKERIGYMTQRFSLYEDLSIRENLEFVARLHGLNQVRRRVNRALNELGLASRHRQPAGRLSGGWKQRLSLAACMIHRPRLLLLDEPTAGVDPKARRDFWKAIRGYARAGVTSLVSTHYMDEAVQCDHIAYIAYGKKLLDCRTAEVAARVGLSTQRIVAPDLDLAAQRLEGAVGVDVVARFGAEVHASGRDRELLAAAVARLADIPGVDARPMETGLEDALIYLTAGAADNVRRRE